MGFVALADLAGSGRAERAPFEEAVEEAFEEAFEDVFEEAVEDVFEACLPAAFWGLRRVVSLWEALAAVRLAVDAVLAPDFPDDAARDFLALDADAEVEAEALAFVAVVPVAFDPDFTVVFVPPDVFLPAVEVPLPADEAVFDLAVVVALFTGAPLTTCALGNHCAASNRHSLHRQDAVRSRIVATGV